MKNSIDMSQAVAFHNTGKLDEAKRSYRRLIKQNPKNHRLYHLLGLVEYQQGHHHSAISYIQQAISLCPTFPTYYKDLANCFKHLNVYDQATANFQKALAIDPRYSEAYYDFGILHLIKGSVTSAIQSFKKAISYNPTYTEAYINLAVALEKNGNVTDAVSTYFKALDLNPENALIYNNLGNIYRFSGKAGAAIKTYQKALAINPQFAEAHCNLGLTCWEMMRYKDAIECFENAIKVNPKWDKPYFLLGLLYQEKGKHTAALNWFEKALTLDSKNALVHSAKGQSYFEKKNEKEALDAFHKALNVDPEFQQAYIGLIKVMLHSCTWSGLERYNAKLDQLLARALDRGKEVHETPFSNVIRHSDPKINFKISRAYSHSLLERLMKFNINFDFKGRGLSKSRIHIAYLSNNFRNHPTANLLMDIFKIHDRKNFKVSCYSYGPDDQSSQREHIKSTCDKFVDLHNLNDIEAAKRIYEDQVDILVDLACFLKDSRMAIAAFRPAPIQIRWLGLAGTTGSKFYDYLITDQMVTPENQAESYSEKFIYLPRCYQISSNQEFIVEKSSKEEWGFLPEHFVFCAFNAAYKIDVLIFQCWLSILRQVPKGVLWLMVESDLAEDNLKDYAKESGIDPERIVFADRLPRKLHLQRLSCADLALDTVSVSGAATTNDALWVNVPVLTVKGEHFASRMSASILDDVGLPDLILNNLRDYEAKAVQISSDRALLHAVKKKLTHQCRSSQLFDTASRLRLIETAYKMAWNRYGNGIEPRLLKVYD